MMTDCQQPNDILPVATAVRLVQTLGFQLVAPIVLDLDDNGDTTVMV